MFFRSFLIIFPLLINVVFAQEKKQNQENVYEVYSGKQDQNWEVVQQELAASKAKLDTQAVLVQNLISEKNKLKGEALTLKIEEIKIEHHKYEKMVFDYNKLNEEYLTKYPERGLKEKRIYKRVKIKSLDSFEDDISIRGKMNKLHKKIKRQYPKVFADKKLNSIETKSTSATETSKDNVTQPIKFKK